MEPESLVKIEMMATGRTGTDAIIRVVWRQDSLVRAGTLPQQIFVHHEQLTTEHNVAQLIHQNANLELMVIS